MQPTPVWFTGGAGNRLAADVSGPQDGPPVLLMHGGGQTRHSWSRAHWTLAEAGYRVISLDARGHGQSDWIENGDYGPQSQVEDLLAVIDTLGVAPALVGASMGGVNSLLACAADPRLASCLILVDVTPRLELAGVDHIIEFMTGNADGFTSLEHAAQAVSAYNPHRQQKTDTRGLEKNLRLRDDGRWYWHWDPRFMAGDHRQKVARIAPTNEGRRRQDRHSDLTGSWPAERRGQPRGCTRAAGNDSPHDLRRRGRRRSYGCWRQERPVQCRHYRVPPTPLPGTLEEGNAHHFKGRRGPFFLISETQSAWRVAPADRGWSDSRVPLPRPPARS